MKKIVVFKSNVDEGSELKRISNNEEISPMKSDNSITSNKHDG